MSILASSLALGAADYSWRDTLCAGTPTPSCSSRSARQGRRSCRSSGPSRCAASARRCGRVPRLRPRHQPGLRHLGRAVGGGAPRAIRRQRAAQRCAAPATATPADAVPERRSLAASQSPRRTVQARERHDQLDDRARDRPVAARARRPEVQRPGGRIEIVPFELGRDERAHDRQAEPGGRRRGRSPARAPAVVDDLDRAGRSSSLSSLTTTLPPPLPSGKPWSTAFCISSVSTTDSGVATLAGIRPPSPASVKSHRAVRRLQALLGEAQQRPHDLDEGDVVAGLARQRLVHEGDRADPPHRLGDRRHRLRVRPAGGPAAAAARRSSAGCSSPGGGSRGSWRPCSSAGGRACGGR